MADADRPTLRLASLAQLRHPMSVDLYVEKTIAGSRCVVLRLLGGLEYWRYGAEEIFSVCRANGIPLAVVPGDVRDDPRLAALSTVAPSAWCRLDAMLREGGPDNIAAALSLAAHLADGRPDEGRDAHATPACGEHVLGLPTGGNLAVIVFYRAHLLALDVAPVTALAAALAARGLGVRAVFVTSLKDPAAAAFVGERMAAWRPSVVLNLTAFAAPLDGAGAPVLQAILAVAAREAWHASRRGLSQTDLAMQVVLPELDGRLLTTAISFKAETPSIAGLHFSRVVNQPDYEGIAITADRAAGWARLGSTRAAERRVALVLSDYPGGGGQVAHAVGLDTLASLDAMVLALSDAGYAVGQGSVDVIGATGAATLSLAAYRALFSALPVPFQAAVVAAWGEPNGDFAHRAVERGNLVVAIQPDRGHALDRKAGYHDADLPPRHEYVAFYLWLRLVRDVHAMVHVGTHGTLEWLPGKAAALSAVCAPVALLRGVPVIYPFIVNNPGEAAAAKRRLGAVTIGHMTPPLKAAGTHGAARALERLIDEYASADGLDRRRTTLLRRDILARADEVGLLAESGARGLPEDDALARLDTYLCDVKELQIRDGLHVFGTTPPGREAMLDTLRGSAPGFSEADFDASPAAEMAALLAALDGRFVEAGPAGAPSRGRADVLPTGRNLFTVDPRAMPTRSAVALAERAAAALLLRHTQEHGDWPRALVIDVWGSAAIRTGGEDVALALVLIGARPLWDDGSARVTGVEVLPIAVLDQPRVDVTLRVSGLFRDAFPGQVALFDAAVRAVATRDEAADWNPLAAACRGLSGEALRAATIRVFGAAPGQYGAGVTPLVERGAWENSDGLGAAYLAAGAFGYGADVDGAADAAGFAAAVGRADAFVHAQDHAEIDLLDGPDVAAHVGGFAAAAARLGSAPALYHLDTAAAPRVRTTAEELARVTRGRAANPAWIAGMMRHGYRGAAEVARAVDGLFAFAATLPTRLDAQFELLFDATLGDDEVDAFLRSNNPDARAAMAARFADARARGLWRTGRNDVGGA